jgi:Ser/Thr protein kinase RdoA (MazF antagonist)
MPPGTGRPGSGVGPADKPVRSTRRAVMISAMMRLDRLAALVATVGPDRTSAVADAAAVRWGLPPGTARYVRTSATCVFATGDGYLRLHPGPERPVGEIRAVAAATAALARAGAPIAAPRSSTSGLLVESIAGVHATLVAAVPGEPRELEDLTAADAVRWGRAVARLHRAGTSVDRTGLPTWPALVEATVRSDDDQQVIDAVGELVERCRAALGPPNTLAHGDAQPDNAGWSDDGPVLFDLDDACVSWTAADLAMAVRDAQPIDALDQPATRTPAGLALLRGYREVAELDPEEERLVPVLQRLAAALTYGRLRVATGPDSAVESEPDWSRTLRLRLVETADRLRTALLCGLSSP